LMRYISTLFITSIFYMKHTTNTVKTYV